MDRDFNNTLNIQSARNEPCDREIGFRSVTMTWFNKYHYEVIFDGVPMGTQSLTEYLTPREYGRQILQNGWYWDTIILKIDGSDQYEMATAWG